MPPQRRTLRKRKSQSDVFSDECDDEGEGLQSRDQADFASDDVTQHRLQRQMRASVPNRQPKSERQQIALLQRLTTTEAREERLAPSTSGQCASAKRQSRVKDINWRDKHGETKLHKLVTYGTVSEIEELIQQGADINAQDNADWTALHEACLKGLPDAVECLLKAGADVNIAGFGGTTPLHDGACSGCTKVVELLLCYGADASRRDDSFNTPLELASTDDVKKCLMEHMQRTAKSNRAEHRDLRENASCTHDKVCSINAWADEAGSSFRQRSALIPPVLENCRLGPVDGTYTRKMAADRGGPFMLYGPYVDLPRLPLAATSLEEDDMEPSPSSSLALGSDVFKEGRCAWSSPGTTPTNSRSASASISMLTISSTSVTGLPSTSAVTLSADFEARGRASESMSDSLMDASDGAFEAGIVEGEVYEAQIFDAVSSSGNRRLGMSRMECKLFDSSCLPTNDWDLVHSQAALPRHPAAVYEDISDCEDVSSLSGFAKTSDAIPKELGTRSLYHGSNSDNLYKSSKNSVVGIPSSQRPGGLPTRDIAKGSRFRAYDLPFFHSYSKTGFTGNLPAAQAEESRWKTSDCAMRVGSCVAERPVVQPGVGLFPRHQDEQKISASSRECVAGSAVSCSLSPGFQFESSDSRKTQVYSRPSADFLKDSIGIKPVDFPEINRKLIRGAQDCGIASDRLNVDVVPKKVVRASNSVLRDMRHSRAVSQSLPSLKCNVCIPRTAGDTREGDTETHGSESVVTEVNNNSVNSVHFSSGSRFQSAEDLDYRLGQSSDKLKSQRMESVEGDGIAVNKFGRDVVVFLRKATVNTRSETKHLTVQNITSTIRAEAEHSTTSDDHLQQEMTAGQLQTSQRFLTFDLGNQSAIEGPKTDVGKGTKRRIVLCNTPLPKKSVPVVGSVLHNGQTEHVLDWNRAGRMSTVLVDKSTMTTASDWDLSKSITEERSDDGVSSSRAAAETQTSITGEVNPDLNDVALNAAPEAAAFQTCYGNWKANVRVLSSSDQSSRFKVTSDSCSRPAGTGRFKSWSQADKSGTPVFESLGKPCRGSACHEIGSHPSVSSYKATRQQEHDAELVSDIVTAKRYKSPSVNGYVIPKVAFPVLSPSRVTPSPRVKVSSVCEEKLLAVHPSASYRGEMSEHKSKPYGTKAKSSTDTLIRKESAVSVPVVAKSLNTRKKNTNNDRVGCLEEDMHGELNSVDCNRLAGTMRRSTVFGNGVGSGCSLDRTKQTRISRDVLSEGRLSHQQSLSEDRHRSKEQNFVLWHGLCSKTVDSRESVYGQAVESKFPSDRGKLEFPKEFERFLMATREYRLHSPIQEICVPSGLELPLRNLFVKQEKERRNMKLEQIVRCERLLLTIEAEVIREYVEEEKRLDEVRPLSGCNVLCQQNYCSRSHENLLGRPRAESSDLKSRLKGLKEKFLAFERDLHFQLQNEISVLHSCQVQEWERMLISCQPPNPNHLLPKLCVAKVSASALFVSAFFDKLNL